MRIEQLMAYLWLGVAFWSFIVASVSAFHDRHEITIVAIIVLFIGAFEFGRYLDRLRS